MAQRRGRTAGEEQHQDAASMMTQAVRRPKRSRGNDPQPVAGGSKVQRAQRDPADRPSGGAVLASGAPTAPSATTAQPAPAARASQRSRRGAASAPAAQPASLPAQQPPGSAHHDRRPHGLPPPDHHAERKAATGGVTSAVAAAEAVPPPATRSGRPRRGKPYASSGSDSDASPPRRPVSAPQLGVASDGDLAGTDAEPNADAAPPAGAQASLFSPVFSLSGGKSAAELPPDGGGASSDAAASGSSTPERSGRLTRSAAGNRPAVCSPARASLRGKLDPSPPPQQQPASDDENANSEHDTQIRLSSSPGLQVDPLASASDADSSQARATPDTLALMCAGEAMSPESSDDEDAARAAAAPQQQQPCSAGGPLQPLPGATLATLPATGGQPAEEEYDDDEYMDFDPYLFIRKLPPLASVVPPVREVLLPRQTRASKRKTLVLDLDETLVHSSLDAAAAADFTFPVAFGGAEHQVSVRRRPHLGDFLERVASLFEVVVFTASQKVYAEQLLNMLDPERRLIRHRIFRDSCVYVEGNYLKDLSILGRDLSQTIIIDNSPQAFGYQLANGIPIESWYDDEADAELPGVLPLLESLVDVADVRPAISDAFKLRERVARAPSPEPGRGGMAGYF